MKHLMILLLSLFLAFGLFACGGDDGGGGDGGGDDGGSNVGSIGLTYTGLTTPASITANNAQDIIANAYTAGSTTTVLDTILSMNVAATTSDVPLRILPADITMVLKTVITKMDFTSKSEPDLSAKIVEESETFDGSCGGFASISQQGDDETGDLDGSMTFNSYCEKGTTITGEVTFFGSIDMSTGELAITMQFDAMTTTNSSQSVTIEGEIDMEMSDTSVISTMNMMVQDNETAKTSIVEDYQMTITEFHSYSQIEISGRFYDPDYGYVDLETPTSDSLIIYYLDDYPSSGQIILTGENTTKARLTALSDTNCQVEADADGDGTYEYSSGPILWAEL